MKAIIKTILILILLPFSSSSASLADPSGTENTAVKKSKNNDDRKAQRKEKIKKFISSLSKEEKDKFFAMEKTERRTFIREKLGINKKKKPEESDKQSLSNKEKRGGKGRIEAILKDIPQETRDTIIAEIDTVKKELGSNPDREAMRQKVKAIFQKYGIKNKKN